QRIARSVGGKSWALFGASERRALLGEEVEKPLFYRGFSRFYLPKSSWGRWVCSWGAPPIRTSNRPSVTEVQPKGRHYFWLCRNTCPGSAAVALPSSIAT